MKTLMKIALAFILLNSTTVAFSQLGMGYYGGQSNKLAINLDFHEQVWTSVRVSGIYPLNGPNQHWSAYSYNDVATEVLLGVDLYTSDLVDLSLAAAWTMEWTDIYYGFGLPVGVKIKPFENARNFAFRIESAPYFNEIVEFRWLNYWGFSIDF